MIVYKYRLSACKYTGRWETSSSTNVP
jgi:hypothetical protein